MLRVVKLIDLGKDGIFISDDARESLRIKLSESEFAALKEETSKAEGKQKCFITGKWYDPEDGIFFSKDLMADGLQKNLDSADALDQEFKGGIIRCSSCGKKFKYSSKNVECPYCGNKMNTKKYYKSIHLPHTKKVAFKLYIKYLRK